MSLVVLRCVKELSSSADRPPVSVGTLHVKSLPIEAASVFHLHVLYPCDEDKAHSRMCEVVNLGPTDMKDIGLELD